MSMLPASNMLAAADTSRLVPAVERAVRLLDALAAARQPLALAELARRLALPKRKPAVTHDPTQMIAPAMMQAVKRAYGIVPAPATKGTKVRTMGMNRPVTIASHP